MDPAMGAAEERFERLFAECYGAVLGYALRRTSRALAEEVVAETFLVAWRRLESVPEPAIPWLLGTARRVLANQRRGERRRAAATERLAASLPPVEAVSPPGDLELRAALASLPEADRELILLLAWDGLAPAEAAWVLGWSRPRPAVRLHRARKRLAAALAAESGRFALSGGVELSAHGPIESLKEALDA